MSIILNRRQFVIALGALGSFCGPYSALRASSDEFETRRVTYGGTGFNVPFSEINDKLGTLESALESNQKEGRRIWGDKLYNSLVENFKGRVEGSPVDLLSEKGDPGLLFSVGFDYENFVQIKVPEAHLDQAALDAGLDRSDISYYYLFSSIRIYSMRLPRDGGGQISLVYSKPIKAAAEELLPRGSNEARKRLVLDTLSASRSSSTLGKFGGLASQIAVQEAPFEPRHLQVRQVSFSGQSSRVLQDLKLDNIFNANLFAAVTGVAVNEAFDASVIPFVLTDYLARNLADRFVINIDMEKLFDNMDEGGLASVYLDLRVAKVLRKISGENASKQQIARGVAIDLALVDVVSQKAVLETKLVRVEKREQVKGATEESWYRANDSVAMYELIERMMSEFFIGLETDSAEKLAEAGIRAGDLSSEQIKGARDLLNLCKYDA